MKQGRRGNYSFNPISIKGLFFFVIFALFIGSILTSSQKAEAVNSHWYNSSWHYRNSITIDKSKVSNTNQSNFPVLVSNTSTDWKDTTHGGYVGKSTGGDILFTSSDGTTKLSHEIEKYDSATGELVAWVKVPTLSVSANTEIYIYYGNASALDQWDTNNVWDSNSKMVQHFSTDASSPTVHDVGFDPKSIVADSNYLYVGSETANGVNIYNKSDFSLVKTLKSTEFAGEGLFVKGNYLAFTAQGSKGYLYNLSTDQYIATINGTNALRAAYINDTRAYFGETDTGKVYYVNLSDLSQGNFTPATDDIRAIDSYNGQLIIASNDGSTYLVDENTFATLQTFTDGNIPIPSTFISAIEVAHIDADYIWFASDTDNVWIKENTAPYNDVTILHGPTNDITGVEYDGNYWFVSSDDGMVYIYESSSYKLINVIDTGGASQVEGLWLDKTNKVAYYTRGHNYSGVSETNVYNFSYPTEYLNRNDSTSNNVELTKTRTTASTTGKVGLAESFNGTDSYIEQKKYYHYLPSVITSALDRYYFGPYLSRVDGQTFLYAPSANMASFLGDGVNNNYFFNYYDDTRVEGGFLGGSGSGLVATTKITNKDFEGGFTAGLANGWGKETAGDTYADETVTVHGGSHAQKITAVADSTNLGIRQTVALTVGKAYYYSAWVYTSSGDKVTYFIGNQYVSFSPSAASWNHISGYIVADTATRIRIYIPSSYVLTGDYMIVDDTDVQEISDIPTNQGFKVYSTKTGNTNSLGLKDATLNPNMVDSYSVFSSKLQIKNKITLEAWVYPNSDIGDQYIAGNWVANTGYSLYRSGKNFYAKINNLIIDTGATDKNSGSWYHVVLTVDGTNEKIYVDGEEYASEANSAVLPELANQFAVGADTSTYGSVFNGKIDEVRVSDTNRSADWIKDEYNSMSSGYITVSSTEVYDADSPTISNILSNPSNSEATISWETNKVASSKIDYGYSNSYGNSTVESDTSPRVTSHSVTIFGLDECTTYHFRVISIDATNNEGISSDNSFTTTGCPTPTPTPSDGGGGGESNPFYYYFPSVGAEIIGSFPVNGFAGSSVTLDATNLFPGKHIVKYVWDFGDGITSEGRIVKHTYKNPGRYTITITGYDARGNATTVEKTIDIYPTSPVITNITPANDTDLLIEGTGYQNDIIYLTIHSDPVEAQAQVDNSGKWAYILAQASEAIGKGDHTISAIDSYKLADNTELKSETSKEYDFKVSVEDGKLKVEMGKTKTWRTIAIVLGGVVIILAIAFVMVQRKRKAHFAFK